jgi:hypothetical protein
MLSGAIILLMSGSFTEAQATLVGQGDPFRINFDENGHGSYQVFNPATGMYGPVVNDPGVIVADSTTPTGTALQYTLPQTVTGGDLGILEPSSTTCTAATCSDAMRFITVAGTSVMRYYSDREANEALDLADSGLPSNFNAGAFVSEVGPEGNNGFMFVAGSGNPLITNFYVGISDVPEPATIALLATGIIGLFGFGALRPRRG